MRTCVSNTRWAIALWYKFLQPPQQSDPKCKHSLSCVLFILKRMLLNGVAKFCEKLYEIFNRHVQCIRYVPYTSAIRRRWSMRLSIQRCEVSASCHSAIIYRPLRLRDRTELSATINAAPLKRRRCAWNKTPHRAEVDRLLCLCCSCFQRWPRDARIDDEDGQLFVDGQSIMSFNRHHVVCPPLMAMTHILFPLNSTHFHWWGCLTSYSGVCSTVGLLPRVSPGSLGCGSGEEC